MDKKIVTSALVIVIVAVGVVAGLAINRSENKSSSMDKMDTNSTSATPAATPTPTEVTSNEVVIDGYAFSPKATVVKVGTTVTWTNKDAVRHTVTADKASADAPMSQLFGKGETYSFTFKKAGTYGYYCEPHPYMKGTVTVIE